MNQLAIVLDELRTVRESTVPGVPPGALIASLPWLESAVARLEHAGEGHWEHAVDASVGRSWLLGGARRLDAPPRLALAAIELSSLLLEDRAGLVRKVVHAVRNMAFASATVVDAANADQPGPDRIGTYLGHIRRSTEGLAHLGEALMRATSSIEVCDQRVPAQALAEVIETTTQRECDPLQLATSYVHGDRELLAQAMRAFVGEGRRRATEVSLSIVDHEAGPSLRVEVARAVGTAEGQPTSSSLASVWELTGPYDLELVVALSFVRRVVTASGGRVDARAHGSGVVLWIELPLFTESAATGSEAAEPAARAH